MSDEYTILIEKEPRRRQGVTGAPQFWIKAHISNGAGMGEPLTEIQHTTLGMASAYIALSAYRFLTERGVDITKTTIITSWKQPHDKADFA